MIPSQGLVFEDCDTDNHKDCQWDNFLDDLKLDQWKWTAVYFRTDSVCWNHKWIFTTHNSFFTHYQNLIFGPHSVRTGKSIWIFDEAVKLYSGSVLCLDNCVIKGSDKLFDNLFKNSNARTEKASTTDGRQKNIYIYGLGNAILDGGEPIPFGENTRKPTDPPVFSVSPIHLHNVSDFEIKNIKSSTSVTGV